MDVLVTGADQRQGLAVIRALGAKGVAVFTVGRKERSLGFCSRYTKGHAVCPSATREPEAFVDCIEDIVRKHRIPVILPSVESTVIALNKHRDRFQNLAHLGISNERSLELTLDKERTYEFAEALGVRVPRTIHPSSVDQALASARELGYPLVVKPTGPRWLLAKAPYAVCKTGRQNLRNTCLMGTARSS